jgi:ketosteroid isomerase-like protein
MKKMFCFVFCLVCFASSSLANESPQALQDAFMTALKANDAQGLAECYSSDAVNFPVDTLVGIGPESAKHLEIHGDTAIAWGLFTIMAEPAEGGDPIEMKGRYMDIARNIDGTWLYVADHASMPLPARED